MLSSSEIKDCIDNLGKENILKEKFSNEQWDILSIFKENILKAGDTEEIYDVTIDALNRFGNDFSFVAIFRQDRKYSTAVRIRVDSDLVNRVEDYARKMMPEVTIMRYRIPIFEEGRLFRRFLLESKKPLVSDLVKVSDEEKVIRATMEEIYENLITADSPLKLLLPAFKRIVPYKSAMSTHIFVNDLAVGNIGFASKKVLDEVFLDVLLVVSNLVGSNLERVGFAKSYG